MVGLDDDRLGSRIGAHPGRGLKVAGGARGTHRNAEVPRIDLEVVEVLVTVTPAAPLVVVTHTEPLLLS